MREVEETVTSAARKGLHVSYLFCSLIRPWRTMTLRAVHHLKPDSIIDQAPPSLLPRKFPCRLNYDAWNWTRECLEKLSMSVTLHLKNELMRFDLQAYQRFFFFFFFQFWDEGMGGDEISFKECDEGEGWRNEGMRARGRKRESVTWHYRKKKMDKASICAHRRWHCYFQPLLSVTIR